MTIQKNKKTKKEISCLKSITYKILLGLIANMRYAMPRLMPFRLVWFGLNVIKNLCDSSRFLQMIF